VTAGQKWTVPIGINIGKAVPIGTQSLSFQIGANYTGNKPDGAADWMIFITIANFSDPHHMLPLAELVRVSDW
jgi:hypothetical protein